MKYLLFSSFLALAWIAAADPWEDGVSSGDSVPEYFNRNEQECAAECSQQPFYHWIEPEPGFSKDWHDTYLEDAFFSYRLDDHKSPLFEKNHAVAHLVTLQKKARLPVYAPPPFFYLFCSLVI